MTDDERNEFEKSMRVANEIAKRLSRVREATPIDHVALCALIRAVELLAGQDQFRDVTKKVEPTSTGHFDDALAERLAKSGSPDWEFLPDYMQERRRRHSRAILAELASMPSELPSPDELGTLWANDPYWAMTLHARIAPILATKDASLAHYRKSFEAKQARVAELEAVANESAQQYAQALARITELESRTPANEKTIELQNRRIAELDREIDTEREKRRMAIESHKGDKASWMERVEELEKRIAELTTPADANGKTPGQIGHEAFLMKRFGYLAGPVYGDDVNVKEWEAVGSAVLRAFGDGAEVLRKIRRDAGELDFDGESGMKLLAMLDAEIANIAGVKP